MNSLIKSEEFIHNEKFILGGGSNLLLTKDFDGIVVRLGIKGITDADIDRWEKAFAKKKKKDNDNED